MVPDIRIVRDPDGIAACMALRRAVFIDEQGVPERDEIDGEDGDCAHVLATLDEVPVGAARLRDGGDYVKIQRVCVPAPYRGRGIGALLIGFAVERAARDERVTSVRLGAQTHALDFYRKFGFAAVGEEYMDAGISHRDMHRAVG